MRVLMVRLDGLGDTILTTPLLRGLHEAGHEVTAIASPLGAQVLQGHPGVASLLVHDPQTSTLREKLRLSRMLRGLFDASITVTEKVWGYVWGSASGARLRVGFWAGATQPVKTMTLGTMGVLTHRIPSPNNPSQPTKRHEVERIMLLGEPLGVVGPPGPLWLGQDLSVRKHDAIAFHLSPKWLDDGYDEAWLKALVEGLAAEHRVLVSAGPAEASWADALAQGAAVERLRAVDFAEWCRELAACRFLVTTDTGASHVGAACGIPVVDVFATEGAAHKVPRWEPWGVPSRVVLRAPASQDECRRVYEEILGASRNPMTYV